MSIALNLPWPPTANHIWKRRGNAVFVTQKGHQFRSAVLAEVLSVRARKRLAGAVSVRLVAYPPDLRRRDLDNLVKPTFDAITKAGVWLDDSQVERFSVERAGRVKGGKLVVMIEEI